MKRSLLVVVMLLALINYLFAQNNTSTVISPTSNSQSVPTTGTTENFEEEENPMRPDFSAGGEKKKIKIKPKNKLIKSNLLKSNKKLFKKLRG